MDMLFMQSVPSVVHQQKTGLQRLLQCAVRALGSAGFERSLYDFVHANVRLDFLTVFVHSDRPEAPRVAAAAGNGDPAWLRRLSSGYLGRHWRVDPATRRLLEGCQHADLAMVRTRAGDIDDSEYRQQCYAAASVRERVSIGTSIGSDCVRINVLRGTGAAFFAEEELQWLSSQAMLLGALAWRHHQLDSSAKRQERWHPDTLERRLVAVSGKLSVRERQVGARIAAGWTTDGIAADLGLSRNSILTFRRRVYAKLGVNSMARLYQLIEGA